MAYQTRALSSSQASSLDKTLMASLAALAMFVAGYTAVRMSLAQPAAADTDVTNTVIPHQAELWSDLAE